MTATAAARSVSAHAQQAGIPLAIEIETDAPRVRHSARYALPNKVLQMPTTYRCTPLQLQLNSTSHDQAPDVRILAASRPLAIDLVISVRT